MPQSACNERNEVDGLKVAQKSELPRRVAVNEEFEKSRQILGREPKRSWPISLSRPGPDIHYALEENELAKIHKQKDLAGTITKHLPHNKQ